MAISEELELDISGALDAIESLNEPLTALGENLTITLTTAIEAVDVQPLADQLAAIDAAGLTTTIDASIDAVDGTVPIDAQTDAVPGEIDAAIDLADTTVVLDADTSGFGGSIDEALAAADATVTIDGDASGITTDIDSALEGADTTIQIDTDTGNSDAEIGGVTEGLEGVQGAAGLATGDIAGMTDTVTALGLKAGPVVGGVVAGLGAIGGVVGTIATKALGAQGIMERFRDVVGEFRDEVNNINVGSLDTDIGKLATKLGSTEAALTDAATNAFLFGKNAGLSGDAASEFSDQVLALSARAVALNPALGSVEDVAAKFQKQLLSGRGITNFVGQLDDADVATRALAISGKTNVEDLSKADLAFARASLGAEKYGKTLDKDITKGSKNAIIQQRSVTASVEDFLEKAGQPLVAPFLQLMKASLPIVKALAPIFVDLGKEALPAFAESLKQSTPAIKAFGQFMGLLAPIIGPLQKLINLTLNPVILLGEALGKIGELPDIAGFFSGIGNAIGSFLGNVTGFGADLIDSFLVGIQEAFPAVVNFFSGILGTVLSSIGDTVSTLTEKGTQLIGGLFTGIVNAAVAVFQFFTGLAGRVLTAIGDVVGTLVQKGSDLIGGLVSGLATRVVEVFNFFRGLPGRIVTAFGNVANRLFNLGSDIIQGLINGIKSKAKGFFDTIKDLAKRGVHLITHPWEALSPSRVTLELGKNIGEGLALGIQSQVSAVEDAASALSAAAAITPATLALPAVAATVPLSGGTAGAAAAGPVTSAQADLAGAGTGVHIGQLIVQTAAKDQTQVGIEVSRQLRAESFRAGR